MITIWIVLPLPSPFPLTAMQATQHIIENLLRHIYYALKERERYVEEGKSRSHYELFFKVINEALSPSQTLYLPANAAVESFYRGTTSAEEFVRVVDERIISKARGKLDVDLNPLLTLSWDLYSSTPGHKATCDLVPKLCSRQIWAIFNKLDTERQGSVDIEDITDLILKLYSASNQTETVENIQEWFCNQQQVDFWSFFSALAENHCDLLRAYAVQSLHKVSSGHVCVHSTKMGTMTPEKQLPKNPVSLLGVRTGCLSHW